MSQKNVLLYETKKAVCLPLSSRIDIGFVAPEIWSNYETCKRQLSWYRDSAFSEKYLVVSSTEIKQYGMNLEPATVISKSRFRPKHLPDSKSRTIRHIVDRDSFRRACPPAFENIDSDENEMQSRWLRIMGIRGISYQELFVLHCANHANFIDPLYYLDDANGIIPYSIGPTKNICSACLEFFNIIGGRYQLKYVVPCPGAVLFAGMAVNQYYKVETIKP